MFKSGDNANTHLIMKFSATKFAMGEGNTEKYMYAQC